MIKFLSLLLYILSLYKVCDHSLAQESCSGDFIHLPAVIYWYKSSCSADFSSKTDMVQSPKVTAPLTSGYPLPAVWNTFSPLFCHLLGSADTLQVKCQGRECVSHTCAGLSLSLQQKVVIENQDWNQDHLNYLRNGYGHLGSPCSHRCLQKVIDLVCLTIIW